MAPKKGNPDSVEAGRRGGLMTAARLAQDPDFYKRIGKKGGDATKAKHGLEHYAALGEKGGNVTNARHGKEHYAAGGRTNAGRTDIGKPKVRPELVNA